MDDICRLCCSTKFVNNNIFDEENALYLKMSLYLPIKVFKNDRLPQKVCDKCSCKVNDFYQFCNEAIDVQNRLKALLTYETSISVDLTVIKHDLDSLATQSREQGTQTESVVTNNEVVVKAEPKIHSPIPPLSVKEEGNYTEINDNLPDDVPSDNSEDELLINLQKDKSKKENTETKNGVVKESKRGRKRKSKHSKWEILVPTKLLSKKKLVLDDTNVDLGLIKHEDLEVKPQDLGVDLDDDEDYEFPKVKEEKDVFFCCVCFEQCVSKADMLQHYKSHGSSLSRERAPAPPPLPAVGANDRLRCPRCMRILADAEEWASHWRKHWERDRRPFRCAVCEKTFRDHHQLFKHGLTHKEGEARAATPSKRFMCDLCPEGFVYMRCLQAHRTRAHPEACARALALRCGVCAREFAHLNSLRRHLRAHSGERNFLCNVCGKALTSREHLKFHIRIHTGYKPNVCGTCGKGFVKKCNLTLHERVHSGEKPHVCSHCGKAFSQRSTLVIHERYHSGARPYSCGLCGRGFVAKGLLSMHLKTACVDTAADRNVELAVEDSTLVSSPRRSSSGRRVQGQPSFLD